MAGLLLGLLTLTSCATTRQETVLVNGPAIAIADEITDVYIPTDEEISCFLSAYNYLCGVEAGEQKFPENYGEILFTNDVPGKDYTSLMFRFYLIGMENEDLRCQILTYLKTHTMSDAYSKSLEKKLQSVKVMNRDSVRFCYNDSEYDENINLFGLSEMHPFDDEFGMLILRNDYHELSYNEADNEDDRKNIWLMCGGGTNSLSIQISEYDHIADEAAVLAVLHPEFFESKFENWELIDVPLSGILERSGATKYYVGIGHGPDIIPEIDCARIIGCLWSEENQKLYEVSYFMNFSQINMYYENRYDMYRYLVFYAMTLFC